MNRLSSKKRADFRLFNIGILYQFFNLLPSLSLKENILLPSNLQEHTDNSIFIELINYFGISEIINKYPEQCSGGECQRAALCRALICKPSLILADEPTGNLDIDNRDRVLSYLEKLAKSKTMAILIATHDPDIKAMANYVWSLESGSLVQS